MATSLQPLRQCQQGRVAHARHLAQRRVLFRRSNEGGWRQWIREGKQALRWTRLSCRAFRANAVRLQLFALAYNLANFLRTLALPDAVALDFPRWGGGMLRVSRDPRSGRWGSGSARQQRSRPKRWRGWTRAARH